MTIFSKIAGSRGSRIAFRWFAASWAALLLHRTLFLISYFPAGDQKFASAALFWQFLLGLRFDLAVIPVISGPMIFLAPLFASLPSTSASSSYFSRIVRRLLQAVHFLQYPWFCLINMTLFASTFNFGVNNKHLGWEYYAYLKDTFSFISGTFEEKPLITIGFLSLLPLSLWLGYRFAIRDGYFQNNQRGQMDAQENLSAPDTHYTHFFARFKLRSLKIPALQLLILILFTVMLRGGVQQNPLRSADAIRGGGAYLNSVALNGLFTIIQDRNDLSDFREFYPKDQNIIFVQNLLGKPEDFPLLDYPLVRKMAPRNPFPGANRPNIVLVLLESFTAKFLEINGGDPQIAPNLNRLIKNGRYYKRFYSSGGRSANGIICMLAGIPDRSGRTILRSAQIQNRFGGIASLLAAKNYDTFFVHGGDLNFDNLTQALPHLGFKKIVGMREMEKMRPDTRKMSWGFYDEDSFSEMLNVMNESRERPFFGVFFSLNTHHPFAVPDKSFQHFPGSTPQSQFLNAYRYTDYALGEFMKRVSKTAYFNNTIFFFVADHAHHAGLNYLEDRTIPFLIYAPKHIRPEVTLEIASQLDLGPTILASAGGASLYAAMGRDLTLSRDSNPENGGFAFFAGGSNTNVIGWIEKDLLLSKWLDFPKSALYRATFPVDHQNFREKNPEVTEEYLKKVQNFHQFARTLEKENRIWPDASIISQYR